MDPVRLKPTLVTGYEDPISSMICCLCDACGAELRVQDTYSRCNSCHDHDLCIDCYTSGQRCDVVDHTFSKQCVVENRRRLIERNMPSHLRRWHEKSSSGRARLDRGSHQSSSARNARPDAVHDIYYELQVSENCNEIRVLYLHEAAAFDAPLTGSLEVVSIDRWSAYHALSYTWGSPVVTAFLELNGDPFPISCNLDNALRRFRADQPGQWLWVDAICINQSDYEERGSQVRLMRAIYSRALKVWTYLGEPDGEILSKPPFSTGQIDLYNQELNAGPAKTRFSDIVGDVRGDFDRRLLSCPWFTRVWVIQEVVLNEGSETIYGDLKFPILGLAHHVGAVPYHDIVIELMDLLGASMFLQGQVTLYMIYKRKMMRWHNQVDKKSDTPRNTTYSLITALRDFRRLEATDPRDKVYAMLGLADDIVGAPRVAYEKPVPDVYQEYSAYIVNKGYGVSLLHAATTHTPLLALPSWVPDWNSMELHILPFDKTLSAHVRACGDLTTGRFFATPDTLFADGYFVDSIAYLGDVDLHKLEQMGNDTFETQVGMATLLRDRVYFCQKDCSAHTHVCDSNEQIACDTFLQERIHICDEECPGHDVSSHQPHVYVSLNRVLATNNLSSISVLIRNRLSRQWIRWLSRSIRLYYGLNTLSGPLLSKFPDSEKRIAAQQAEGMPPGYYEHPQPFPGNKVEKIFKDCMSVPDNAEDVTESVKNVAYFLLTCRRLCIMKSGRLGFVPNTAEPGDEIVILPGAITPFVIRRCWSPAAIPESRYRFIGDSYVRGTMYGEGLAGQQVEPVTIV